MECYLWCDEVIDINRFFDCEDFVFRYGSGNSIVICFWCFFVELFKEVGCVCSFVFCVC